MLLGLIATVALKLGAAEPLSIGYRGDTCGRFPTATAPINWKVEDGQGLVWKVEMAARSVGGLIVVADKVFTQAEPDTLMCLNAVDGKELWRQTVDRFLFFGENGPKLREIFFSAKDYDVQKFGAYGLNGSPQMQAWREAAKGAGIDFKQFAPKNPVSDGFQYTCSTPCSDGQRIYVMIATGVVAAYDLEGKEIWSIVHDLAQMTSSNMVLCQGRLFLGGGDRSRRDKEWKEHLMPGTMAALDAATGKELWRNKDIANGGGGWGSPLVATLAGRTVVVSGGGQLVDPATGAILASTAHAGQHSSLAVADDLVIANSGNHYSKGTEFIRAFRITASGQGLTATKIWEQPEAGGNHTPIVALSDRVVVQCSRGILRSYALSDGRVLGDTPFPGSTVGAHCPGPSLLAVGDTLVAWDINGHNICLKPEGDSLKTIFAGLLPHDNADVPPKSRLGFVYAAPFLVGGRAYLRTNKHVYCFGK